MRIPRIYVATGLGEETVALPSDTARRLSKVLRLRSGDRVDLFDGRGGVAEAVLVGSEQAEVKRRYTMAEMGPRVCLYPALIRANRFDWLVEKGVELGAAAITPVHCERSITRPRRRAGGALAAPHC